MHRDAFAFDFPRDVGRRSQVAGVPQQTIADIDHRAGSMLSEPHRLRNARSWTNKSLSRCCFRLHACVPATERGNGSAQAPSYPQPVTDAGASTHNGLLDRTDRNHVDHHAIGPHQITTPHARAKVTRKISHTLHELAYELFRPLARHTQADEHPGGRRSHRR